MSPRAGGIFRKSGETSWRSLSKTSPWGTASIPGTRLGQPHGSPCSDLPVVSHELIALCAPRPCFISDGLESGGLIPSGLITPALGRRPSGFTGSGSRIHAPLPRWARGGGRYGLSPTLGGPHRRDRPLLFRTAATDIKAPPLPPGAPSPAEPQLPAPPDRLGLTPRWPPPHFPIIVLFPTGRCRHLSSAQNPPRARPQYSATMPRRGLDSFPPHQPSPRTDANSGPHPVAGKSQERRDGHLISMTPCGGRERCPIQRVNNCRWPGDEGRAKGVVDYPRLL